GRALGRSASRHRGRRPGEGDASSGGAARARRDPCARDARSGLLARGRVPRDRREIAACAENRVRGGRLRRAGAHAMKRILAQIRKELTQILRDRLALVLALALPVGIVALLGTTISLTVSDLPIVIQDLDQTPLSRQCADASRTCITSRISV